MNQLWLLTLTACLTVSAAGKLDRFHAIKTSPVQSDGSPPNFDELRRSFLEETYLKETDSEVVQIDNEVIVISATQEVKMFLSNAGDTVEQILFRDLLPNHAIIEDFHVRNRGLEDFRSVEKHSLPEVEEHFLNAEKELRTTALLGMLHSSSSEDNIQWMKPEDLKQLEEKDWRDSTLQAPAILMRVIPGDVFSIRIAFKEVIPGDIDYVKDMYTTHLTAHMGSAGTSLIGLVESPNYPFNYPDNGDIKWLVRLPANHDFGVKINILEFDTESCCDRVYFYDGATVDAPILGMAHGNFDDLTTTVYESTGPDLLVEFRSDCFINNGSFSFNFTSINFPTVQACAGQEMIEGEEGYIVSTNYPDDYPEEANCEWLIVTPRQTTVVLEIVDFQIDGRDHVTVYEIYTNGKEAVADLSGAVDPYTIYGHSESMEIVFASADHFISRRGFVFHFYAEVIPQPCDQGVVLEDSEGEISSQNYPLNYNDNSECTWQIRVEEGHVVYMTIDYFQTEEYYDYLYIYDGPDEQSYEIAGISGLEGAERSYLTTGNIAFLKFVSDYSNSYDGFHMTYQSMHESTTCSSSGIQVTGDQGFITSPNYPDHFPSFSNCSWLLQSDPDTILSLILVDVNLGRGTYNQLTIYDGSSRNGRVLFSDNHIPLDRAETINATQNEVLVDFISQDNWEERGFLIRFEEIDMVTTCSEGLTYGGPQGSFSSPLYPGYYPDGYSCSYAIRTPLRTTVELLEKEFQLGPMDTLIAYDGTSDKADILFECSGNLCPILPASRNNMYLVFTSMSSNVGFDFNYYGSSDTCEGSQHISETTTQEGFITSPMYPANYNNYEDCHWNISALPREVIEITIDRMQTEACCDWLYIYDGDSTSAPLLLEESGDHQNIQVTTTGNEALVVFRADYSVNYRGFSMHYNKYRPKDDFDGSGEVYECSVLDLMQEEYNDTGYIVSPGYSTHYPDNLDYCWRFEFPARYAAIEFTFARVDLELQYDYIQVFQGDVMADGSMVAEITGRQVQYSTTVIGRTAQIRLHTDESVEEKGFVMKYEALY